MIDTLAQERYARWMARQPVGGVAVWAHTGRGLRLSESQRALCWRLEESTPCSALRDRGRRVCTRRPNLVR